MLVIRDEDFMLVKDRVPQACFVFGRAVLGHKTFLAVANFRPEPADAARETEAGPARGR